MQVASHAETMGQYPQRQEKLLLLSNKFHKFLGPCITNIYCCTKHQQMWQTLHYNSMVTTGMMNSRNHTEGFLGIQTFLTSTE
jgi:hypothetical protein